MTPYPFEYHRASSIEEAIAKLQEHGEEARFVAGGHSLIPSMKLRLSAPSALIDLQGLDELKTITDKGQHIDLGALVTHRQVETSDLLKEKCPVLAEAAAGIGDPQVRNKGTIGGSLAHADPAADYPAVVLALGARISVQGASGSRTIDVDDYFKGMFETELGENELITGVSVPVMQKGMGASYAKFPNPASKYAVVGVAALIQVDAKGRCTMARIGVTGASAQAFRARAMEETLLGASVNEESITKASSHLPDESDMLSDLSGSQAYRAHLCGVMARRALTAAAEKV